MVFAYQQYNKLCQWLQLKKQIGAIHECGTSLKHFLERHGSFSQTLHFVGKFQGAIQFYHFKVIKMIDFYNVKLSPPITPNPHNRMPFLYLNSTSKNLQLLYSLIFLSQERHKGISREVTNYHQNIFLSIFAFSLHKTHMVYMEKIQGPRSVVTLNSFVTP